MINKKQNRYNDIRRSLKSKVANYADNTKINDFMIPETVWNNVTIENVFNLSKAIDDVLQMFDEKQVVLKLSKVNKQYAHIQHFIESDTQYIDSFVDELISEFAATPEDVVVQAFLAAGLEPYGTDGKFMTMSKRLPGDITIGISTSGIVPGIYPNEPKTGNVNVEKAINTLTVGDIRKLDDQYSKLHQLAKRLSSENAHITSAIYEQESQSITQVMSKVIHYVSNAKYAAVSEISGKVKALMATEYAYNTALTNNLYIVANSIGDLFEALPEELEVTPIV